MSSDIAATDNTANGITAAAAMKLSVEAGWNQTEDDWRVFLSRGRVFGAWEAGTLVASAAALPYEGFGFVSMVLTSAASRRRGHGTALLEQAVAMLTDAGLVPVLDATPLGRTVYERQGFVAVDDIERWGRDALAGDQLLASPGLASPGLASLGLAALGKAKVADVDDGTGEAEAMVACDALAFGSRRDFLLRDFLIRLRTVSAVSPNGFGLARTGRLAAQIGPIAADDETQAGLLLDALDGRTPGPAIIDVPARWKGLAAWLDAHGFRRQRAFTRMARGRAVHFGDPARQFATAGPEFG